MAGARVPALPASPPLLDELARALTYPKLGFTTIEVDRYLHEIRRQAIVVEPDFRLSVIAQDPEDDRVLECAISAGAAAIATGDRDLIDLRVFREVTIMTARAALERF